MLLALLEILVLQVQQEKSVQLVVAQLELLAKQGLKGQPVLQVKMVLLELTVQLVQQVLQVLTELLVLKGQLD